MENSIRLAVEIVFTKTGKYLSEQEQKTIMERVLNALKIEVDAGNGLVPDDAEYTTEHIYVKDYFTGGREIQFIHSF